MELIDPVVFATDKAPFVLSDHHLVSSNVAEDEYTEFSITESVSVGDRRQVTSVTSTVTLSIATPCVVAWVNHLLVNDTAILFTTTGALPTGIVADQVYYVVDSDFDSFKLALKPGGTPINTGGSQSGIHTAIATVHGVYEAKLESAQGTATVSGTVMTVTGVASGVLAIGMIISGSGIVAGTRIVAFGTGSGGVGTYIVSINQGAGATIFCRAPYTDKEHWARVGATNRWRMHDSKVITQTSNLDSITNYYTLKTITDSIAFLKINAATVRIKVTENAGSTVVYDTIKTTEAYSPVTQKIERFDSVLFNDLPSAYLDVDIEITLTATGETVFCGACVMGKRLSYGNTQYGLKLDLLDFTVKDRDGFGNYDILERDFSKTIQLITIIKDSDRDVLFAKLIGFRAKPIVYIGMTTGSSAIVFGFFADFSIEIPYKNESLISIDIEGLTE